MPALLPSELQEFVEQEIASGKYRSADEVICEALRLLREREHRLEELRKEMDVGLDQAKRGEVIALSDEESRQAFFDGIKARGRQRLEAQRNGQ